MARLAERDAVRERICEAMIDLVLERGYEGTSVEMVLERAGVSLEDFESHFAGKAECAGQILDWWSDEYLRQVWTAYQSHGAWRDRLRAAGYASARVFERHPREVRFCLVEMTRAGNVHQAKVELSVRSTVDMIDAGRQELDDPDSISRSVAEWVAGSFMEMAMKRLSETTELQVRELVPQLMYTAVRPYLGAEVAAEELSIPPPVEGELDG
ncbi:MAG TPA: TetR/AcrR family transcriptional regulator [Solirubrobacterales bacterium]|nr:TetR/AcrR family transcriptional regulator [Solirubrobacterales bacterium]